MMLVTKAGRTDDLFLLSVHREVGFFTCLSAAVCCATLQHLCREHGFERPFVTCEYRSVSVLDHSFLNQKYLLRF